ncbi:hypothetical protein RJT34_12801 [Clitoria ternatea]|uniref:H(+)-transporting two-sector ATPase n=2 Tax=Magnoliopsida TaxID=3398 RepID=A0AAN9PL98_CLITE
MHSAVGYQPTLSTEMGSLQERITSTKEGFITSIQAVYVPADDLTDPAPTMTFAYLDATIVLSRGLAAKARADDSHAPPVSVFPKACLSFKRIHGMSSPGKFHPSFILVMDRSPRFGSISSDNCPMKTRFRYGSGGFP